MRDKKVYYLCRCDCGKEKAVRASHLASGNCKSCGCLAIERSASRAKHGGHKTSLYYTWRGIKDRTTNPDRIAFPQYGGRGINLFHEWVDDFSAFRKYILEAIGPRPQNTTLDRIDNEKGYEPGNLRWATGTVQGRNKRTNRFLTANNKTMLLVEWAELFGVTTPAIEYFLRRGRPFEEIYSHYMERDHKPKLLA